MEQTRSSAMKTIETGADTLMSMVEFMTLANHTEGLQALDNLTKIRDKELEREVRAILCDEALARNNWRHANSFLDMI